MNILIEEGLGTRLVRFFQVQLGHPIGDHFAPRTLGEFVGQFPEYVDINPFRAAQNLVMEGVLDHVGSDYGGTVAEPWMGNQYFTRQFLDEEDVDYGVFDFLALGFHEVYRRFTPSVLALEVTRIKESENGESEVIPDIGTGFLIEGGSIVTARHCVENVESLRIEGWSPDQVPLSAIYTPANSYDLACLVFEDVPLVARPHFRPTEGRVLDEVLTMGYPPIPGMQTPLVAETARVASVMKASVGEVVAEADSYLDYLDYFLISARVKGGNSGGPVISSRGEVVGVVSFLPELDDRPDVLGYAAAIPGSELRRLIDAIEYQSAPLDHIPFEVTESSVTTRQRTKRSL